MLSETESHAWKPDVSLVTSDMAPVSSKEFFDVQANIECGFTLKVVPEMIRAYSQMQDTDEY